MEKGMVSVIVPCYKQAEYLPETLESVLAQTYPKWECVIVNDGSPDNTEEIANEFLAKDNRFKYIRKENQGVSAARNVGISKSKGEFVLPLDADDLIDSSYIGKAVGRFVQYPETKLVYCKADKFGKEVGYWDLGEYEYEKLLWYNCIFCTAMFRRADFDLTKGYNVNMNHGIEDWDFWLTLLKKNDLVYRINEVLFHYRIKEESRTVELKNKFFHEAMIQLCKNHPDVYMSYYENIIVYHNYTIEYFHNLETCTILRKELEGIRSSRAYRLGKLLLKPITWFKNNRPFFDK